jgi:hypothetical protein
MDPKKRLFRQKWDLSAKKSLSRFLFWSRLSIKMLG